VSFIIAFTTSTVFANDNQTGTGRFKVRTFDGAWTDIHHGQLLEDEIRGVDGNGSPVTVQRDNISTIRIRLGSHAGRGLAIGGLAGFALFASVALAAKNDHSTHVNGAVILPMLFGTVGGGALIGLTIGALHSKWEYIGTGEEWSRRLSMRPIQPTLSFTLRF